MADEKTPDEKRSPSKTLTLKPRISTGTVRQSFSHGRTKQVVVEKRGRQRISPPPPTEPDTGSTLGDILGAALKRRDEPADDLSEKPRLKLHPILPLETIPEQNLTRAIAFKPTGSGPLDLLADPPKDPFDPEQAQLYARIRAQLKRLKDDIPSQERNQINDVVDDFLNQPPFLHEVQFKKILWLCGNALRSVLAQHDAIKTLDEPHYSKLPPSVAESIRRPIQEWNVFVFGDPDLREMDDRRIGPQEQQIILQSIAAAKPIAELAAANRDVTTEQAAKAVELGIKSAEDAGSDINAKQRQDVTDGTLRNLISQIVRRGHLFCSRLIEPQSDEDKSIVIEYKKGIAKAAGVASTTAALGAVTVVASYSIPYATAFFELIASNPGIFKDYVIVAFQNNQVAQIIDTIVHTRLVLREEARAMLGKPHAPPS